MSIYALEGQPVITRLLKLASTWTAAQDFDAAITVQDDGLKIENPAATYAYTITGGAITAARQLNLPVTTGTDTLMVLGLDQTVTGILTLTTPAIGAATGTSLVLTGNLSAEDLLIEDSDASHYLTITTTSNLTAARTLTLVPGDAARTITLSGDTTLADWFDQSVKTTANPTFGNLTITSFAANWTNVGRTVADLGAVTTVDINGGTVDGVTVGAAGGLSQVRVQDNGLQIENPAADFEYTIVGAAIAADRQLNLPLITGTDTLSALGLAETHSALKTFSAGVDVTLTTDATSPTAGAMKTAGGLAVAKKGYFGDLVDITKSGSPYTKAHQGANGPHLARIVASKNNMTDNTLTSFLRVTVPDANISAILKLDYLANSDFRQRYRMGGLVIYIARGAGVATLNGSAVYITEQTLLTAGAETLAVTFALSANTGAADATQTFDIQVTIDSSGGGALVQLHYSVELLSGQSEDASTDEITIAAV